MVSQNWELEEKELHNACEWGRNTNNYGKVDHGIWKGNIRKLRIDIFSKNTCSTSKNMDVLKLKPEN